MTNHGYKKYMKKNSQTQDFNLVKLFIISFCGMLLLFTFLIKSFLPSADVSVGDYKQEYSESEVEQNVDGRLAMIQDEDRGQDFSELMKKADDVQKDSSEEQQNNSKTETVQKETVSVAEAIKTPPQDPVYKVFIGSYTSAEQAKVAKDIIQEAGANLNPIVKCIGSNNYTLQVGIYKNKSSAEALLNTIQQNRLPGRIVQEY